MVGVGGAEGRPRGGAGVRRGHLPCAPDHPATVAEARTLQADQGTTFN